LLVGSRRLPVIPQPESTQYDSERSDTYVKQFATDEPEDEKEESTGEQESA
jgi:hypothetical protein